MIDAMEELHRMWLVEQTEVGSRFFSYIMLHCEQNTKKYRNSYQPEGKNSSNSLFSMIYFLSLNMYIDTLKDIFEKR